MPDGVRQRLVWCAASQSPRVRFAHGRNADFCLWGPTTPNSNISDTEGDEVAWCTKKGYGARLIPQGALLGAQILKNADYLMITGLIDQTKINIHDGDSGGELDSGSQDGVRGLHGHTRSVTYPLLSACSAETRSVG
jgi:hypothetical protein